MSTPAVISVLSTVYVKSRITASVNGAAYDPTGDTVEIAFKAPGTSPAGADWRAGSWETANSTYFARLLIGPASPNVYPVGTYAMWIKITDNPEIPVLVAGNVRIY